VSQTINHASWNSRSLFSPGDALLRIDRAEAAETWFGRAEQLGRAVRSSGGLGCWRQSAGNLRRRSFSRPGFAGRPVSFLGSLYVLRRRSSASFPRVGITTSRPRRAGAGDFGAELKSPCRSLPDFAGGPHLLRHLELVQEENRGSRKNILRRPSA